MKYGKIFLGYQGYQISNKGRIKSIKKHEIIMKQRLNKGGYLKLELRKNGKTVSVLVHRLVALAFIPNPENKPQINHKNSIRTDNKIENLEWCTQSENNKYAYCYGNREKKLYFDNRVLINQYDLKGNFIKQWLGASNIEKELNISNSSIIRCCKNKSKTAYGYIWKYANESEVVE